MEKSNFISSWKEGHDKPDPNLTIDRVKVGDCFVDPTGALLRVARWQPDDVAIQASGSGFVMRAPVRAKAFGLLRNAAPITLEDYNARLTLWFEMRIAQGQPLSERVPFDHIIESLDKEDAEGAGVSQ